MSRVIEPAVTGYRVVTFYRSNDWGKHGWAALANVYATRQEADAAMDAPLARGQYRRDMNEVLDAIPAVGRLLATKKKSAACYEREET